MTSTSRSVVVLAVPNRTLAGALVHAIHRRGWLVIDQADNLDDLVDSVTRHEPALVVTVPELGGRPVAPSLATIGATGDVVVIGPESSDQEITSHLLAGAQGWFDLDAALSEVLDGMAQVLEGWPALGGPAAQLVLHDWRASRRSSGRETTAGAPGLTRREADVLAEMGRGLTTKEIATELGLAVKTVENHKTRVFTKLGARNTAHALTIAADRGLLAG